jgi:hypothetical protein
MAWTSWCRHIGKYVWPRLVAPPHTNFMHAVLPDLLAWNNVNGDEVVWSWWSRNTQHRSVAEVYGAVTYDKWGLSRFVANGLWRGVSWPELVESHGELYMHGTCGCSLPLILNHTNRRAGQPRKFDSNIYAYMSAYKWKGDLSPNSQQANTTYARRRVFWNGGFAVRIAVLWERHKNQEVKVLEIHFMEPDILTK